MTVHALKMILYLVNIDDYKFSGLMKWWGRIITYDIKVRVQTLYKM
jgi:hypothetical protein